MPRLSLAALAAALVLALVSLAGAHDSWINRGGFKNPAGHLCCGDNDCGLVDPRAVSTSPDGYALDGAVIMWPERDTSWSHLIRETVPYREALPSLDGMFWRCHSTVIEGAKHSYPRRCFFAPSPAT